MEPVTIPRRIDDPPHLLLWSVDEMAPLMVGLLFGMMIEQALYCTLAGFLMTHAYKRFRDNSPDGYMMHWLYWHGLSFKREGKNKKRLRYFTNPFLKTLLP